MDVVWSVEKTSSVVRASVGEAAVKRAMPVVVPPRFTRAPDAVVAPVPPSVMATGVAIPPPAVWPSTTSVPSQYRMTAVFCETTMPDPDDVFTVRVNEPVVLFVIQYCCTVVGTMMSLFPVSAPVRLYAIRFCSYDERV